MTVCKFFQQGYCRYGQSCRFEHVYGSKYSYHATPPPQTAPVPASNLEMTDEQIMVQVQADIKSVLHSGQWILSCYAPLKEKPIIPGLHDLSPEEMRLFIYEARANNTLDQAITYINSLIQETRQKYEQLLQPTPNLLKTLRTIAQSQPGQTIASPFTTSQPNPGSVFRNAVQGSVFTQNPSFAQNANPKDLFAKASSNTFAQSSSNTFAQSSPNTFAQTSSIFAQNPPDSAKSIFAQNTTDHAKSIFAQNTTDHAQSIFAQNTTENAKSIFAQANQNSFSNQSNFATPTPTNIFATANQSLFKTEPQVSPFQTNTNVFQTQAQPSIFSQNVSQSNSGAHSNIYSKMEELSMEDLEAFKSDSFQLGFVPEIPPPQALCS